LRARGFQPKTICHWQHRRVADEIARAYYAGELAGPVTIIGYSCGADAACLMCSRLNRAGVPVTNLILIESTLGIAVPANVSFCYNIYESRWADAIPAFRGIAVNAKGPNTQLLNVDVNCYPELAPLAERNHFTIASAPEMHSHISELLAQRIFQPIPAIESESSLTGPNALPVQKPGE
jgi:thioesterase domain-containing protein